jgi:hypothetical protein
MFNTHKQVPEVVYIDLQNKRDYVWTIVKAIRNAIDCNAIDPITKNIHRDNLTNSYNALCKLVVKPHTRRVYVSMYLYIYVHFAFVVMFNNNICRVVVLDHIQTLQSKITDTLAKVVGLCMLRGSRLILVAAGRVGALYKYKPDALEIQKATEVEDAKPKKQWRGDFKSSKAEKLMKEAEPAFIRLDKDTMARDSTLRYSFTLH